MPTVAPEIVTVSAAVGTVFVLQFVAADQMPPRAGPSQETGAAPAVAATRRIASVHVARIGWWTFIVVKRIGPVTYYDDGSTGKADLVIPRRPDSGPFP
jgi:hypothetical protein